MSRGGALRDWLRARVAPSASGPAAIAGGPSLAYTIGWIVCALLALGALTGVALSAFYSPSSTSAWASVAYVQDKMAWGWLVRGLHHHGASAIVIAIGLHMVQAILRGAYKAPRELSWWLGLALLLVVLGFTISGYVLRWDQSGYWANRVEIGIAASTPVIGDLIRRAAIGGNDYGNLTLTRFYALHVVVLPAIVVAIAAGHVLIARRHGATPRAGRDGDAVVVRWPAQTVRTAAAIAAAFVALFAYVVMQHGADLAAPADPAAAFDARPLWYFRWLFELRHLTGSYERFAALAAPAIVLGYLAALPLLDRKPARELKTRVLWVGGALWLCAMIAVLTAMSFAADSGDPELAKREAVAQKLADRTRMIAALNGVPSTGPKDLFTTLPMYRARTLFNARCADCHDAQSKDRKGPIIGPGHGNRAWLTGFLAAPSGTPYWGKTKLAATDDAMKPAELSPADSSDLVELLYAQSGAPDVDTAKRDRGKAIFDKACTDCHSIDEGVAGTSAPGLDALGSRDWYTSFIANPKAAIHMSSKSEMPRFDRELSIVDRDAIAAYLTWLRTATQADLDKLGPL